MDKDMFGGKRLFHGTSIMMEYPDLILVLFLPFGGFLKRASVQKRSSTRSLHTFR